MQLRFFDYLVIIVTFMFVSLRGDKLLGGLKLNNLSNAIPLNRGDSSALLHALLFVVILIFIDTIAAKIAGAKDVSRELPPKIPMSKEEFRKRLWPMLKLDDQKLDDQYNMYLDLKA